MKTPDFIKNPFLWITIFVISVLSIPSCTQTGDSKKTAEQVNKEALETKAEEKDAQFLVDVAEINLEEIQLGQLAQSKSTVKEVKDLGKMMEDQHTQSFNQLKELASKKGISIPITPTVNVKEAFDKMSDKKESDFNEDYCNMMVKGHKDAIDKVEKAATESKDEEIKSWASEALPTLRKHLEHAMNCQSSLEKYEGSLGK